MGEGSPHDEELLHLIDSANVCCGVHAGSASLCIATAVRCSQLGVEVVAHPGYDDRENFGRVEPGHSPAEIRRLVAFQVGALKAVAGLAFVKPHGALYHRCQTDPEAARSLVEAAEQLGMGVVGQPGFEIVAAARKAGLRFRQEAFADRAYQSDGSLVPRSQAGSVLAAQQAAAQAARFAGAGDIDTICLHSDSPGAVEVAQAVRSRIPQQPDL